MGLKLSAFIGVAYIQSCFGQLGDLPSFLGRVVTFPYYQYRARLTKQHVPSKKSKPGRGDM